MQVGDLVKCPAFDGHAAYAGIILGVYGHKVEVLGGTHKSWDGIMGKMTWDICDIHLINSAPGEVAMKVGDLVLVTYGDTGGGQLGTYVRPTEWATDTRADILYSDGDVCSTPLCQIEVVSESR